MLKTVMDARNNFYYYYYFLLSFLQHTLQVTRELLPIFISILSLDSGDMPISSITRTAVVTFGHRAFNTRPVVHNNYTVRSFKSKCKVLSANMGPYSHTIHVMHLFILSFGYLQSFFKNKNKLNLDGRASWDPLCFMKGCF